MADAWTPKDTTTHQDHVIAHVLGATFLGYFLFAEAVYILLDIGFIWSIYLDGEMGLLPHPVAVSELDIESGVKEQLKADIDILLSNSAAPEDLLRMHPPPDHCEIKEVSFFANGEERRLIITGDEAGIVIETSLATAEVQVMTLEEEDNKGANGAEGDEGVESDAKLEDVAQTEHEYLHQRLREDLGREPTEEELDEWLRQHTEGY